MAAEKGNIEFHAVDRSKIRNKVFKVLLVPYKSKKDGLNKVMLVSAKTGIPLFHMGVKEEKGITLATTLEQFAWEGMEKKAEVVEA